MVSLMQSGHYFADKKPPPENQQITKLVLYRVPYFRELRIISGANLAFS